VGEISELSFPPCKAAFIGAPEDARSAFSPVKTDGLEHPAIVSIAIPTQAPNAA
jgi:hypothetical protein